MKTRISVLIGCLLLGCLLSIGAAAPEGQEQILRFRSAGKARVEGRDHLVVTAYDPSGRHPSRLVVANKSEDAYDPVPEQANVVKGLQPGTLIQVVSQTAHGIETLTSISTYSPKPGEEQPDGFVFVEDKIDDPAHAKVTLSKLGVKSTFNILAQKDESGAMTLDPLMTAALDKIKEGDSVWIEKANSGTLSAILSWSEPDRGKLLKIEPADVNGQSGIAVQIDNGGKTITALVPGHVHKGKWISDPKVLSAARRFRTGATVIFRVQADGDKTWLRDIHPEPRPIAQRNAPANNTRDRNGLPRPRLPGGGVPSPGGIGF